MLYDLGSRKTPSISFSIKSGESQIAQSVSQILRGYSAYEIAVQNGFEGTEEEWLNSLLSGIPAATAEQMGVVRSTPSENGVEVSQDGSMEVTSLNVNKLVQTEGDVFVLKGAVL